MVLVVVKMLMKRGQRQAAPGSGLPSASLAHNQLALCDEAGDAGEEQGEGGHGGTAVVEEVEEERREKGREHQGHRWCRRRPH